VQGVSSCAPARFRLCVALLGALAASNLASTPAFAATGRFVDATTARKIVDGGQATVLDARGSLDFTLGHIAGATRFDWEWTRAAGAIGGDVPADTDSLARRFAEAGVDDARPVLVCGRGAAGWGEEARIAWTLALLGKREVHVLDGGCVAWRDAGGDWMRGLSGSNAAGSFTASPNAQARAMRSDVIRAIDTNEAVLLDVRSREEFDGATPYGERRGGHLPNAVHLDWRDLYDAKGRVLKGDALRELLLARGIADGQRVIAYCTGGVRSALATEVLRANGIDARNYDASMWAWAADESLPLR
jgi:thiosulfate/3-mercaptopyruvate sulfurtransferase